MRYIHLICIWVVVFIIIFATQPDPESRIEKLCEALAKPSKVAWMTKDERCYFINPITRQWDDVTPLLNSPSVPF